MSLVIADGARKKLGVTPAGASSKNGHAEGRRRPAPRPWHTVPPDVSQWKVSEMLRVLSMTGFRLGCSNVNTSCFWRWD